MDPLRLINNLFIRVHFDKLPTKEKTLLELLFLTNLHRELADYYQNMSIDEKGLSMTNATVLQNIVNDLLTNNDYTLLGLAHYTGFPEEVIYDLALGSNPNPTISLATKIIELHMIARRDLYNQIISRLFSRFENGKLQ